jgi:hypothetical protein
MRSRLEARWGVFFDTLGIPWEYEKEGYILEGTPYLPDFWLPEQDMFVEIKGQEPTGDEMDKARLLALYTQKKVVMFCGPIEFPPVDDDSPRMKSYQFASPSLWKYEKSEGTVGGPSTTLMDVPNHILILMQNLHEHHLSLVVSDSGNIITKPYQAAAHNDDLDLLIDHLQEQVRGLQLYKNTIKELQEEIRQALTIEEGWTLEFFPQDAIGDEIGCIWLECDHCGDIQATLFDGHRCDDDTSGIYRSDTPRLMAAYTAARSARFEFGEKGR